MLPLLGIPTTIQDGMSGYRDLFPRQAGFDHVSRYISGLLLSENKTLQGIHHQYVSPQDHPLPGRRAMHAGVFESPWQWEEMMSRPNKCLRTIHRRSAW